MESKFRLYHSSETFASEIPRRRNPVISGSSCAWKSRVLLMLLALLLVGSPRIAPAAPPIWESNFGPILGDLTGDDDETTAVALAFPFPFEGMTYVTVYVGTNGGIQLGGLGTDGDIDYDNHNPTYIGEFLDDGGFPTIFPFETDLDLNTTGTIHFLSEARRAVFTWNEVGTSKVETHLCSFQLQLYHDGRILFGYNGLLNGVGEDLVGSLSYGILVGISKSNGQNPGPVNLSSVPFSSGFHTIYEVWNYEDPPVNTLFDLDMTNLGFKPRPGGGFDVSNTLPPSDNKILATALQSKIKKFKKKLKRAKKNGQVSKVKKLKKKIKKFKKRVRALLLAA